MNKIILACFQDDRFSLIFEPLVSELLMIKLVVVAWIGASQWMYICLLFDISPKSKIQIQKLKCFLEVFNRQIPMFGFQCVAKYVDC
jgi:hypothetical protein